VQGLYSREKTKTKVVGCISKMHSVFLSAPRERPQALYIVVAARKAELGNTGYLEAFHR